jgi:hypothetical protein
VIRLQAELLALEARFSQARKDRQMDRILREPPKQDTRLAESPWSRLLRVIRAFHRTIRVSRIPGAPQDIAASAALPDPVSAPEDMRHVSTRSTLS